LLPRKELKSTDEKIDRVKETVQTEVKALSNGLLAAISTGLKNVDSSLGKIQTAIEGVSSRPWWQHNSDSSSWW